MNQEKIGNFITFLRKKMGLTQSQLGEKVGVTSKAVSKWERGICIPDVSKLNIVADVLNVSVFELLNGEGKIDDNKKTINEITKNSIEYYSDLSTKKNIKKIILISFIFVVIFVFVILAIFGINNFGKVSFYSISSSNGNYVGNGNIFKTNENQILILTNLNIIDEDDLKIRGYDFEYSLFIDDQLIERSGDVSLYVNDDNDKLLSLNEYINTISIYISDDLNQILFNNSNLKNQKLLLEITYIDDKLDIKTYNMEFLFEKHFSNDKLLYENNNE